MILTADYHTHTPYSHGKNTVMENALAAKAKGLKAVAITDHGFNHVLFGLRRKRLPSLRREIEEAAEATGLNVLMGMESNLISLDGRTDMRESDLEYFDIYLCGIHEIVLYSNFSSAKTLMAANYFASARGKRPSERVIELTTAAYINAIKNNPIDILTHINYRCFCNVKEVAKACADYGTYIELNTKKSHVTAEEVAEMASVGARFVIDSDAHSTDRVGDTALAEQLLAFDGAPLDRIDNIDGRTPTFRFSEYRERHG